MFVDVNMMPLLILVIAAVVAGGYLVRQCRRPSGVAGKILLWAMNRGHSALTGWALQQVQVGAGDTILDVGCGGGRMVQRLAEIAVQGRVYGVNYSETSVAAA